MSGLDEATEKMRADGAADVAIETFRHYYERLAAGEGGTLRESEIEPVDDVPDAERAAGSRARRGRGARPHRRRSG